MTIDWAVFLAELASNPVLVAVTLLNIGVIVVNGATDAPNAIATVVSTRAMRPKAAILMAAICNFLGLLLVSLVTAAVAHTIFSMVDFGGDAHQALIALMAAMIAIIVWGAVAWFFGIPTSQSHSLIAGLTGAAIALQGSFDAINGAEWMKVDLRHPVVHVAGLLLGVGELPSCSAVSVATWTGGRHRGSSAGRRLPRALAWRSCTARRTARSL